MKMQKDSHPLAVRQVHHGATKVLALEPIRLSGDLPFVHIG